MKKLILIRFGMGPMPEVSQTLAPHFAKKGELLIVPGSVISIFETNSDRRLIAQQLRAIPGCVFFLLEASEENLSIHLPEPLDTDILKSLNITAQPQQSGRRSASMQIEEPQEKGLVYYRAKLESALKADRFEQAAIYRDKIKEIEENEE
jgi:hypothetical protein